MVTDARARILGDVGGNASENWWWGKTQPDAALLVYGRSAEAVTDLRAVLDSIATRHEAQRLGAIPLKEITKNKQEIFGFVDGISQPVIRGTYKGLRAGESIHLVEAGEFILGYPDNRGSMPPGPTLPATADCANLLPLTVASDGFDRTVVQAPRELGRNGSFLVIRQLEQDRPAFDAYCEAEAVRLKQRLPPPYDVTADFIAAKLVGRWRDGSSLVRHPYESRTRENERALSRRCTLLMRTPRRNTPISRTNMRANRTKARTRRTPTATTACCLAPKTRKGCVARLPRMCGAPTRATVSILLRTHR